MAKADDLYEKFKASANNVSFSELMALAIEVGFMPKRNRGSHKIMNHRDRPELFLNLQEYKGKAKPYQVRHLLALIDEHDLLEG